MPPMANDRSIPASTVGNEVSRRPISAGTAAEIDRG